MFNDDPYNRDPPDEPAPRFATKAEIELAERLRHRLEERYLGPVAHEASAEDPSSGKR